MSIYLTLYYSIVYFCVKFTTQIYTKMTHPTLTDKMCTLVQRDPPRFIGKLMKLYFKQCAEKKYIHQTVKGTFSQLTGEEKFNLFLKHVTMHRCLPGNPDWVGIYEYLVANNKLKPLEKWESLGYMKKLKHAREEVSEWTYGNYEL